MGTGRSSSVPNTEEPQPYLMPQQFFPAVQEDGSVSVGQRNGASLVPAPAAAAPYNSKSIPRSWRQENRNGGGGDFVHTNGQHPQVTSRGTISHDTRSPPPKLPSRSSTEADIQSHTHFLDENDDPYEMMMSSPVRSSSEVALLPTESGGKPKPTPRPRKQLSPKLQLASPPPRQPSVNNDYVELCKDAGTTVQDEGASVVTSSITQLSQVIESNDGGEVVPEELAENFTPGQLQLLITMLQKVQAVQSGEDASEVGSAGGTKVEGGGLLTPTSPRGNFYEVSDYADLKGNLSEFLKGWVFL